MSDELVRVRVPPPAPLTGYWKNNDQPITIETVEQIQAVLPELLQPRNLLILTIVFLIAYWILSTLKFVSSIILKVLVALLVVTFVAHFLGVDILSELNNL